MLRFPADWTQRYGHQVVTAMPPGLAARVRYHERWRPQPAFSTIVERILDDDAELRAQEIGPMPRRVTAEGEYGASIVIHGRRGDSRAMRCAGDLLMPQRVSYADPDDVYTTIGGM